MAAGALLHRRIRLGPGGEFDLIRSFLEGAGPLPEGVRVGPGDDCAVLDAGPLALSTDLSVEDVHFRRAWLSPEEIGWRAAASALSDLAAVAAEPVALLVSIAVTPEDVASGWAGRVMAGIELAASEVGAGVAGGDVSRSPGPAVIDVVAAGRAETPLLRDGARAGDEVWVTGELGGAAAAVALLDRGQPVPDSLRVAFTHPLPRIREALWLKARADLHALIDLSDGLAGDAGHITAASGVAVELDVERLPIAQGAGRAEALAGGEDYELCVIAATGSLQPLAEEFERMFRIRLTRVGRIEPGEGVWARLEHEAPRRLEAGGFSHFAGGE